MQSRIFKRARRALRVTTRQREGEYKIVNKNGSPYKSAGYVWVQSVGGDVSAGDEVLNKPIAVRQRAGAGIVIRAGRKVYVGYGYDGMLEIKENVFDDLIQSGIDPAQLNIGDERQAQSTIEQLNNLRTFPLSTPDENIQIVPTIYQKADGTYAIAPQSFTVDLLTSYTPSDENDQVVVCVWLDTSTNTYTTTASSELSQDTNLKADTATAMTYINEAAASAPNNYIGVCSYIIFGDTTTVTETNRFHDLRGIIAGRSAAQESANAYATKTANYTITNSDFAIGVDASGGAITITLPTSVGLSGRQFVIKALDVSGGNITIDANGTQTIDGQLTQVLNTQYDSITILSDGANWLII